MPDRHFSAGALFTQTTQPQTVPSGNFWLYPKSDGAFYLKGSGTPETALISAAGGNIVGPLSVSGQLTLASGIHLLNHVPATITNRLYNNNGTLFFNNINYSPSVALSTNSAADSNYRILFVSSDGTVQTIYSNSSFLYNPAQDTLTVTEIAMSQVFIGEIDRLTTSTTRAIAIGGDGGSYGPLHSCDSTDIIGIGTDAGAGSTSVDYSVFIGYQAGYNANASSSSYFIGTYAGYAASDSSFSNFIGNSAGYAASDSSFSNFIGQYAGVSVSDSSFSNFIGNSAGYAAGNSSYSNFIGQYAGVSASSSSSSNFIGNSAGYAANNASNSNFIGENAGRSSASDYSTYIGHNAGRSSTGDRNIELITTGPSTSILGASSDKLNIQQTLMGDLALKRISIGSGAPLVPTATLQVLPVNNVTAIAVSGLVASGAFANNFIDMSGIWNTTGTPTAIRLNVTDTASNANSLFADFRKDNITRFSVSKNGAVYASGNISTSGDIFFARGNTAPVGVMSWDDGNGTVALGLKGGNVTLNLGQENVALCYNGTGSPLVDGQVVYISGAQGMRPRIGLASAVGEFSSSKTFGVVTEPISNGAEGFVTTFGLVRGFNTASFGEGSGLWLSTTPGVITMTRPQAPNHGVFIGHCVRSHASAGEIFVNIQNGFELNELHNVLIQNVASGQVLQYDSSSTLWKNTKIPNITSGQIAPSGGNDGDIYIQYL